MTAMRWRFFTQHTGHVAECTDCGRVVTSRTRRGLVNRMTQVPHKPGCEHE